MQVWLSVLSDYNILSTIRVKALSCSSINDKIVITDYILNLESNLPKKMQEPALTLRALPVTATVPQLYCWTDKNICNY